MADEKDKQSEIYDFLKTYTERYKNGDIKIRQITSSLHNLSHLKNLS